MSNFEVPEPIICSPYFEPDCHWEIEEGEVPDKPAACRREAGYYFKDPKAPVAADEHEARGRWVPLEQVNLIRERVNQWRKSGYQGASRTTQELLKYWTREGRQFRLFFAQIEAAETIIFLKEARADYLQGINIPLEELSEDRNSDGYSTFQRYACKMATGTGKTTVMAMLAAWSILNKVADRSDSRYSDVVLVVCPNVTIKNRLGELDPQTGDASLYITRDIVPRHLFKDLTKGRVLITNWHVFEPKVMHSGGVSGKVLRTGKPVRIREKITIGAKTTTARGIRYLSLEDFNKQVNAKMLDVIDEERDKDGNLKKVIVESVKYVQSDTALINEVLGREVGGKQNILVFNDEAHHAYRIKRPEPEESEDETIGEEADEFFKEATVWIDGLDKVNKLRGVNFCVDLSATPYFLGRVGQETNRIFPWVVSEFGLTDSIESGLVKVPQLVVRDSSGDDVPGYFNIWHWILKKLTPRERGGKRASPKPEAILKWASHPISMLGALWDELRLEWDSHKDDPRPPVFIIVCKNTRIAKVIYEWLAEDNPPTDIPPSKIEAFYNSNGKQNTIRVDTKVVQETDTGNPKSDEFKWMRLMLDTVGNTEWPADRQGRPIYPEGFEELAKKLEKPLHPPGMDVRCIVSVGMLTEGWDCNTVTHIIGLRPFMSQLLCEQVVGRGLRRSSYEVGEDGKLTEEVAKVFGVPFEIIPFKENKGGTGSSRPKRHHVHAIPEKARFEIRFPRVDGYQQAIRNRVTVDWGSLARVTLDPHQIPPDAEMKANIPNNQGRPSLSGPGKLERVDLSPFRKERRMQELVFEMAKDLTREYTSQPYCEVTPHVLFPQLRVIVEKYLNEKVRPVKPAELIDVFLSPYYGWVIERLNEAIKPDTSQGELPELPKVERNRPDGSTQDVDYWTSKDVREVIKSHLNYVVADTKKWEQSAAYKIDTHSKVDAFVKNAGLGFTIPYFHNGESHDFVPDFIIRLVNKHEEEGYRYLILETKGFDELAEVKSQAAHRWCNAVNATGKYGHWDFVMVRKIEEVTDVLSGQND